MKGVQQPPEFHPEGDVWTHTLIMLGRPRASIRPRSRWASCCTMSASLRTFRVADRIRFDGHVELGVKHRARHSDRLRFSNADIEQVIALVANHMRFSNVHDMRESTLKRFLRLPGFDEHLELHRLDCLSSHGSLANYEFARESRNRRPKTCDRPASHR